MSKPTLLDTGPLVAMLDRADMHHPWSVSHWAQLQPPMLTCEPVITEACYLLRNNPRGGRAVMELIDRGIVQIAFQLNENIAALVELLCKYTDVPMSLADACLVCMAELQPATTVFTLDSDFRLYRKRNRKVIPVLMPDDL